MKFTINNDIWEIKENDTETLKQMYEKQYEEKAYYVFGVTVKPEHIIYINKDMCKEQQIRTLKHELTHCYIWEYGLYNVMDINEEVICDIVASSNDFINEVVNQYLGIEPLYLCDKEKNTECKKNNCDMCMMTKDIKYAKKKCEGV